jgi:TRAP-type C4-dicarboxylate transport system substrate-binding protein
MNKKVVTLMLVSLFVPIFVSQVWAQEVNLKNSYNWKMTSVFTSGMDVEKGITEFIKTIDQRTKGKAKITLYETTLGAPTDHWDMTKSNAIQFAFTVDQYNMSRIPILTMVGLPMEYPNSRAVWLTANEWLKAGYLKELTDNFKVLFFLPTDPQTVFLRNKKVLTMDDFKGLKIRIGGGDIQRETTSLLGAAGIGMPGAEQYMALQTGVLDGAISSVEMALDRKFYEVTKYVLYQQPIYFGICMLLMNKDTWNSMEPELQKVIEQTANEISSREVERRFKQEDSLWANYGKKAELYTISKEESQKWRQKVAGATDKYVNNAAAKGFPAKEALALMRKVTAQER